MIDDKRGTTDIAENMFFPGINHYYGNVTRQFMIGGVFLMMLGAPFYAGSLRAEFPFEVVGALLIVAFAALTNPFSKSIIIADTVLSGATAFIFGTWAFAGYESIDVAFILRDAIALVFLVAFYFSLKTLRAMMLHQIGKPDSDREFLRTTHSAIDEVLQDQIRATPKRERSDFDYIKGD